MLDIPNEIQICLNGIKRNEEGSYLWNSWHTLLYRMIKRYGFRWEYFI